jgi:hypothetical protein
MWLSPIYKDSMLINENAYHTNSTPLYPMGRVYINENHFDDVPEVV